MVQKGKGKKYQKIKKVPKIKKMQKYIQTLKK